MAFKVVSGSPRTAWFPVNMVSAASTLYLGQLSFFPVADNGLAPLAAATGAEDTSGKQVITGIVVGTNDLTPTFDATYGQYITAVDTLALQQARRQLGAEGMFAKGDPQALVQVDLLSAQSVIKANIGGSATVMATAPTLLTVTTGSTTGTGFTSNATQFTPVAQLATVHCRTGGNAGLYRISSNTSTTAFTFTTLWPNAIAIGDTFVAVPYRLGFCYANINTTTGKLGLWLNGTALDATNSFIIDVIEMDLAVAGSETITFRFAPGHFDYTRA